MKNEKITSIIFITIICILSVLSIIKKPELYSDNENRLLTQKPKFSLKSFLNGNFTKDYEEYLNDQFVFKDNWVKLKTYIEIATQKKEINNVYLAKDHYLIEKHSKIDEIQLNKNINFLNNYIKKATEFYSSNNVKVLIAPQKDEVLKDKLPLFAPNYNQNIILNSIKNIMPDNFIDVLETLNTHNNEYIYYKTDHHMTTLGSYYLYLEIADAFNFVPLTLDDFNQTIVSKDFLGTTVSKINVNVVPDEITIFEAKNKNNDVTVTYNLTEKTNSLYANDKLSTKDKYAYFLNGNNAFVEINTETKNGRNLFIIKDSYANCLIPFLINHFENIYVIDLRYININVTEYAKQLNTTDILVLYNTINFAEDKYIVKLTK